MCKNTNHYSTKKYRIKFYLDQLPFKERAEMVKTLPAELGVSDSKLRNLIYAEIGDPVKLSLENSIMLAEKFSVDPADLINENFPSLMNRQKAIAGDLGLSS